MEDKEAVQILKTMLEKDSLAESEKEALRTAIGILSWTKLIEGRMRSIKDARNKRFED